MIKFKIVLITLLSSFHLVHALSNFTSSTFPPISYTSDSVSNYSFSLKHPVQITLDKEDASKTDVNDPDGLSLIPPTLQTFVSGFRTDLKELLESTTTLYQAFDSIDSKDEISIPNVDFNLVETAPRWTPERRDKPLRIHFSLLKPDSDLLKDPKLHYLASPSNSSKASHEAYILKVTNEGIQVQGVGVRGAWWASRILLQELALSISSNQPSKSNSQISTLRSGISSNSPSYPTRGLMLDAGRHWYSKSFLKDFCSYLSFFSINEFHYHLSDHYPLNRGPINTTEDSEGWKKVYSHFSLKSNNTDEGKDQPALSELANEKESLDYEEFMDFQNHCAEKGITVIPEIEAPGHALAITQWQPQIAFSKTEDLLNLSHPLTLPTMKRIWSEFLPWFQTKEIHIGADEYNSTLADDYIDFVNDLSEYIMQESGKKTRLWGTLEPSPTGKELNRDRLIMQHWQYTQDDPIALLQNFSVINSQDWWAYTTLKNDHSPISPAPYPLSTNVSRLLHFSDPFDSTSPQWSPSLFNQTNQDPSLQAKPNDPNLKGSVVALWNDNGQNATTQLEAFNAGREGIPIYASRTWSGERGERLDISNETQLFSIRDLLINLAPNQNLDRKLKKPHRRFENGSSLIRFDERSLKKKIGHGSIGLPYSMKIGITSSNWCLKSEDGRLNMTKEGLLTFTSDGIIYPLRNVSENDAMSIGVSDPNSIGRIWNMNQTESSHQEVVFPLGEVSNHRFKSKPEVVELEIKTDRIYGTRAYLGGEFVGRFETLVYGGHNIYTSWSQMAFVAPVDGLWEGRKGSVVKLEVRRDLPSSS